MRFTGIAPDYIRHTYKVSHEVKTYKVYSFVEVTGNKNLLTEILRIEKFNEKSNASNIDYYLRLRTASSWGKSEKVTGLRPFKKRSFHGNRLNPETKKRTLLIFQFSNDWKTLFVDVYSEYYPNNAAILQNLTATY
jgi:hypothetical protein